MKTTLIALLMMSVMTSYGQKKMCLKEEIEKEKKEYFLKQMALSPDKADEFWKAYSNYVNKNEKIRDEKGSILKYLNNNAENIGDEEIQQNINKFIELGRQQQQLDEDFIKKMKADLPAGKVLKVFALEHEFKRHLIEKMRSDNKMKPGAKCPKNMQGNPPPPEE